MAKAEQARAESAHAEAVRAAAAVKPEAKAAAPKKRRNGRV